MPEIGPAVRSQDMQVGARKTSEGEANDPLPGVKTDSVKVHPYSYDPKAYEKNRELARRIDEAVRDLKSDPSGPQFVLGWRLYPNRDHPRWKPYEVHSCGCGCGCASSGESNKKA